ncbi:hypothetical protein TNCV_585771 [Trichonephila clavipes]|nr:hypothetical protein TNCV_585771 [Trichonephila clavipes]
MRCEAIQPSLYGLTEFYALIFNAVFIGNWVPKLDILALFLRSNVNKVNGVKLGLNPLDENCVWKENPVLAGSNVRQPSSGLFKSLAMHLL